MIELRLALPLLVVAIASAGCAGAPRIAEPPCDRPAPILGQYDGRAPGYQVKLRDPKLPAREVLSRYGLEPRFVGSGGEWASLDLVAPQKIARLRCDRDVESIQFDVYLSRIAL
jgi:hypothetical protein